MSLKRNYRKPEQKILCAEKEKFCTRDFSRWGGGADDSLRAKYNWKELLFYGILAAAKLEMQHVFSYF